MIRSRLSSLFRSSSLWRAALGACVISAATVVPTPVMAQDYISKANALYADIPADRRSDTILIPALKELESPPAAIRELDKARILGPGMLAWNDATAWASKPAQKAAIVALKKATEPVKSGTPMAWGQAYGVAAVTPDLVRAKLYTELGDPPLLSAAQFLYLPKLDELAILVNVEATRLQQESKINEAMELVERLLALGRQIADRQFFSESRWGLTTMVSSLERMRDLAYVDFRGKKELTAEQIRAAIRRLDATADLRVDRILFPQADLIGADQAVALVMVPRAGVNERTFPTTMATLTSASRPLRLFSEAASWKGAGASHADWASTTDEVKKLGEDYRKRWPLDWFHTLNQLPFERTKMDPTQFAVLSATVPDLGELFNLRQAVRVEVVGTRQALAIVGFFYARKAFPPKLSSIAPEWMPRLDVDPFNPNLSNNARPPLEYFVPIRDTTVNKNADPVPHEMKIVGGNGVNFSIKLRDDTCVIYSVGSDNRAGFADKVQNSVEKVPDVDYLIWPSVLSLYRQHLNETGELK
ncbi:MAG: hypothetical protein K2Y21_15910 [Phycisphaerales bacterium]|nr:hypothetical protein [Phycisphaerales bacterium]